MNFKTAQEKFIAHLKNKNRSPATILAYAKDIDQLRLFCRSLTKNNLSNLTFSHLKKFIKNLEKQNFTPKTISRKINSLKTFYRFLLSQKIVKENFSVSLNHPKINHQPPRVLQVLEYRSLRDTVRSDPRLFAIVELMLQTGIRISETANIRLEDLIKKGQALTRARPSIGPGRRGGQALEIIIRAKASQPQRAIPLNSSARKALKNYLAIRPFSKDSHVFLTKTGRPFLIRNIRASLNRGFRLAGIKNACVNDLRNTFIAHQLAAGTPLPVVSKIAGHHHLTTTQKYLNLVSQPPHLKSSLPSL